MSTNSTIAEPHGDAFRGRYVHWDGYPRWMGRVLHELVSERGVEQVRKVLLHDNPYGWSCIDNRPSVERGASAQFDMRDTERFTVNEGWGTSWTKDQGFEEWLTADNVDNYGYVFKVYVMGDEGLLIHDPGDVEHARYVPWSQPMTDDDWEKLEDEMQAADASA